jgi:hypothetical protein
MDLRRGGRAVPPAHEELNPVEFAAGLLEGEQLLCLSLPLSTTRRWR